MGAPTRHARARRPAGGTILQARGPRPAGAEVPERGSSVGARGMTSPRLSALDASFLAVETPTAHMHVGWVAMFSASAEGASAELPGAARPHRAAPRSCPALPPEARLAFRSDCRRPEWIDDPAFSIDRHIYWAPGSLDDLVDEVMSIPLRRDRPLWEMWICENESQRRFAIVGKTHHCMVDGLAALELAYLLLDPTPDPVACEPEPWEAEPEPGERSSARARAARSGRSAAGPASGAAAGGELARTRRASDRGRCGASFAGIEPAAPRCAPERAQRAALAAAPPGLGAASRSRICARSSAHTARRSTT